LGNFYTNITLARPAAAAVAELTALGRDAYVADAGETCVVYDRQCEEQDTQVLSALAEHLATRLDTWALAVLNHDDSILWFQCYARADLVAEYANRGGPRADVRALCRTLGRAGDVIAVWLVLRLPFLFQVWRHQRLVRRLGLPGEAVGLGFTYLARGEVPAGLAPGRLIRVGRSASP
jgi:hypothetical protein